MIVLHNAFDDAYVFAADEVAAINRIGATSGCHTCGRRDPETRSGNWIGDLQPPTAVNHSGKPQRIFPHCLTCQRIQAGYVFELRRKNGFAGEGLPRPSAVVLVTGDRDTFEPPRAERGKVVFASTAGVSIGCRSGMDGTTCLRLLDADDRADADRPLFDGLIATPSRRLDVVTPDYRTLATRLVRETEIRLRIWCDHAVEPDQVDIAIG
ncbi:MAG: hypothetical protein HZA66_13185 [Rhodopseudomonas palustris]|uniref:Uncharacterized protein n=1 Tax=Rhodopseudomonas palustris TaxID=1076 RepID=A0A933RXC8_RHOPL|nr:hypothetical protein [Rhodopseudomonas palustris]